MRPFHRHILCFLSSVFHVSSRRERSVKQVHLPRQFVRHVLLAFALVRETVTVFPADEARAKASDTGADFPLSPLMTGCAAFGMALLLMLLEFRSRRMFWLLDVVLMLGHGLAGCLILFVFLFSEHPTLDSNWLVGVLNPLPLVALPYVVKAAWRDRITYWHHFMAVWLALFLLFIPWMPQQVGVLMVAVVATLLCRQVSYLLHYGRMEGGRKRGTRDFRKKNNTKSPNNVKSSGRKR